MLKDSEVDIGRYLMHEAFFEPFSLLCCLGFRENHDGSKTGVTV